MRVVEERGLTLVEGTPGEPLLRELADDNRLVERCFEARATAALLYAANLTPAFFDLRSGEAGAILQKLRTYQIRLAVVAPAGSVELSERFRELLLDERRARYFGVFDTREAALAWLAPA